MRKPKFHTNRANRARIALLAYCKEIGSVQEPDLDVLRDLIQDAIHWQARRDPEGDAVESVRESAEDALNDFPSELLEAPDV